ncbi:MAG TPA: DinB family protein [Vicinamibacterales bacterium]|nr:DinB family protein [Vicinamibacterales bacterium]
MTVIPSPEVWLRGPVDGVAPVLQPVAHALVAAREDIDAVAPRTSTDVLWTQRGAASAAFHVLHMAGALDRLFSYARGEALNDAQKAALRFESQPHPEMDGVALARHLAAAVDVGLAQLRATDSDRVFDDRKVGRAGLPSNMLGLLFHAAEHTTRHAGQFITTVKLLTADGRR